MIVYFCEEYTIHVRCKFFDTLGAVCLDFESSVSSLESPRNEDIRSASDLRHVNVLASEAFDVIVFSHNSLSISL